MSRLDHPPPLEPPVAGGASAPVIDRPAGESELDLEAEVDGLAAAGLLRHRDRTAAGRADLLTALSRSHDPHEVLDTLATTSAIRREVTTRLAVVVAYGVFVSTTAVILGGFLMWAAVARFEPTIAEMAREDATADRDTFSRTHGSYTLGPAGFIGIAVCGGVCATFLVAAAAMIVNREGLPLTCVPVVGRLNRALDWADATALLAGLVRAQHPFGDAAETTAAVSARRSARVLRRAAGAENAGYSAAEALRNDAEAPLAAVLAYCHPAPERAGAGDSDLTASLRESAAMLVETADARAGRLAGGAWVIAIGLLSIGLLGYATVLFGPMTSAYRWLAESSL